MGVRENADGTPQLSEETGEPVPMYKFMSSRSKNKFGNTNYFNNIKDAIQGDISYFQEKHKEIQKAAQQGNFAEATRLREDLFNLGNRRAVQLGYAENLKETYRQIAELDNSSYEKDKTLLPRIEELQQILSQEKSSIPELEQELESLQQQYEEAPSQTEAMRNGFTDSLENLDYKTKAEQAIKTLDELQSLHTKVMRKYNVVQRDQEDPLKLHLADFIFDRYAKVLLHKNKIREWEQRLTELNNEQQSLEDVIGDEALAAHLEEQKQYEQSYTALAGIQAKVTQENDLLEQAEKNPSPQNLQAASAVLEKYGAIGVTEEDNIPAIKATRKKLKEVLDHIQNQVDEQNQKLLASSGYENWLKKNPGKTFTDYQKEVNKKFELSLEEKFLRTNLQDLKNIVAIQSENPLS